jgi:uncharacterized repeat protein (TIGR01451 family)
MDQTPSPIPSMPTPPPQPKSHGILLTLLFLAFTAVGFALAWYLVPRYIPEVGKFYAAETITCADAGYNYPDDVCTAALEENNPPPNCSKRQQFEGKEFDGYCFICDSGALEQYCDVTGGGGTGGGGETCDPSKISTTFNGGTVTISNGSTGSCEVSVVSWRIYDQYLPAFLDTQQQNDAATATVNAGSSTTLSVSVPDCSNQVDAGLGAPPSTAHYTAGNYIDGQITMTDFLCDGTCIGDSCQPLTPTAVPTLVPSPPPPTLSVASTCTDGSINGTISWNAVPQSPATPGEFAVDISTDPAFGSYFYKWVTSGMSTDFSGFVHFSDNVPALSFAPNTTYYVRVYNGQHGPASSFTTPGACTAAVPVACSPKTQQVTSGVPSGPISATGGDCPANASCVYGWTADEGVTLSQTFGSSVTATYTNTTNATVTKNITVHFGPDQSDTCSIQVAPVPPTAASHMVCQNNACVSATGAGTDQCSSNANCAMTLSVTPGSLACDDPIGTTLSWTGVTGADHYTVGRSTTSGTGYTSIGTVTVTTFTDSPPPSGTVYYVVTARTASEGVMVTSNQVSTTITATTCPGPSHMACVNNACTVVATAGANTCSTSADCVAGLACSPASQQGAIGQYGTVQASGGSGSYTWTAPGSAYMSQVGTSATFRYDQSGNFTITVNDTQSRSATCAVIIPATPPPTVTPVPTTPALSLQKLVRNVTHSTGEAESVNASPADTVEFSLRVASIGAGDIIGAVVRDSLPAGLTYQPGTTTIDNVPTADGIMSSGVNLGNLASGRTVIVRFRATVASTAFFNIGTTVLTNVGSVYASNAGQLTDIAQVLVTRGTTVTQVPTGPGESAALALIISAIITLLYVGYTSTDSFKIHEAGDLARRARGEKDLFNFKK